MVRSVEVRSPSLASAAQDSTYPFEAASSHAPCHGACSAPPTSRRPSPRAHEIVPRAPVLARPLQLLDVAALRRVRARPPIPRAAVLARPLQHLEVAIQRRARARVLVPRAAVLARPLQHLEVAAPRRFPARLLVPQAAVLARPASAPRRGVEPPSGRPLVPRAACAAHFRPRGGRPAPRPSMSARATGSTTRAPTSAPRCGRPSPRTCTSSHPTGNSPRGAAPSAPARSPIRAAAAHGDARVRRLFGADGSPAHISALEGIVLTELLYLPPRRVHRVAHVFAHGAKHREVRGVGQVLFHKNDGDIEGKARKSDARLRVEVPLSIARARLDTA